MNLEQALNILAQASAQFRGTAQEHALIRQAGQVLMNHIQGNVPPNEDVPNV